MKKSLVTIALCLATAQSFAWGQREQDTLRGIVIGSVITDHVHRPRPYVEPAPVYVQPQPVYVQPQICGYNIYCGPTSCVQQPVWNQWGQVIGYQSVCR